MAFFYICFGPEHALDTIWHGRGGQGVVIAAQTLAEAAYLEGFKGVTSAPTFGPERRGCRSTASTRISKEPIRIFSQIEYADVIVVLDETIFGVVDILSQAKQGALILINSQLPSGQVRYRGPLQDRHGRRGGNRHEALPDQGRGSRNQHASSGCVFQDHGAGLIGQC